MGAEVAARDARPAGLARTPAALVAPALLLADAVLLLFAAGLWVTSTIPVHELVDAYLLGDAVIGASFAGCGGLVVLRVRRHLAGWLMLVGGSCYLVATAVGSLAFVRIDAGDGGATSRALALVFVNAWMPAVAICFPLALQLFPTGRPINRGWRWFAVLTVVGGSIVTVAWLLSPTPLAGIAVDGQQPLVAGVPDLLRATLERGAAVGGLFIAGSAAAPLFRLVRRHGEERLQVLWLVWAVGVVFAVNVTGSVAASSPPPLPLLTIPLIPLAMTAAILRYHLFGITVVVNRTLVYGALTGLLLATYLLVVLLLGRLVGGSPVRELVATGVVGVAFSPLRERLQRAVDRLMYGSRADPYGALAQLSHRLQTPMSPDDVLPEIADAVAGALRLPYVRVFAGRPDGEGGRAVERGVLTGATLTLALSHRGEQVGTVTVGLAGRADSLDPRRAALLADLVRQAGPAVHSVVLTDDLVESRQRSVLALEEERTRIRRDLHDGLGPVLTGVVLKADAARNLLPEGSDRVDRLLEDVSAQTRDAIGEVRRLVYGLRPPALDELGFAAALRGYVGMAAPDERGGPRVGLDVPEDLPRLTPAVEVAAYRIATEAVANALRHTTARRVLVRVSAGARLRIEVTDDGGPSGAWTPGVGLASMRERAAELGGTLTAGGSASGGRVVAELPLEGR